MNWKGYKQILITHNFSDIRMDLNIFFVSSKQTKISIIIDSDVLTVSKYSAQSIWMAEKDGRLDTEVYSTSSK